jgi:heptosyltransferase-2
LNPDDIRRILIVQTAFLGDVILTTPLIEAAHVGFPGADIHIMVVPAARNLVENRPDIGKIILFDKKGKHSGFKFLSVAREIRTGDYDLVLSPHRSFRSALLSWMSRADIRIGFHNSAGRFLYTRCIPYRRDIHEIDRNLSLIEVLGVRIQNRLPSIYPTPEDRKVVDGILRDDKKSVVIAPGSVWATKRWPKEYFQSVVERLTAEGVRVILIGAKYDRLLCQAIKEKQQGTVENFAGQLTMRQSAELVRRCAVLVSNDSAPVHLAVAVATPVVAIFGPTITGFGFAPYGLGHAVVEIDLACRPCGKHGGRTCPIDTHECMIAISPERVYRTIREYVPLSTQTSKNNSEIDE